MRLENQISLRDGMGSIHGLQSIFLFNPLIKKVVSINQKKMYTLL